MLITGATPIPQLLEFTSQVLLQPAGDFLTKLFVFGTETQFHGLPLNPATRWPDARDAARHYPTIARMILHA